jgi:RNA polymerase sigma-70 factor (ECF subfamily)
MEKVPEEWSGDLLARWRSGDQQAAVEVFRRYTDRLIALARSRLSPRLAQRIDPEDVVQSVYRSFFAESRAGRYDLQRGGDLWRLLVAITLHKLNDQIRRNTSHKRGVQREQNLGGDEGMTEFFPDLLSNEPGPVEAVALFDELEQLMRGLSPPDRQVFQLRLQGHNLKEIAAETKRGTWTVRRVLNDIKDQLEQWYARHCAS